MKGDVVVVSFPFSDLSSSKRRPALVVAKGSERDLILAQITSKAFRDAYAIELTSDNFVSGGLHLLSYARPNKIFTAEAGIILYKLGCLKPEKMNEVVSAIIGLLSPDS